MVDAPIISTPSTDLVTGMRLTVSNFNKDQIYTWYAHSGEINPDCTEPQSGPSGNGIVKFAGDPCDGSITITNSMVIALGVQITFTVQALDPFAEGSGNRLRVCCNGLGCGQKGVLPTLSPSQDTACSLPKTINVSNQYNVSVRDITNPCSCDGIITLEYDDGNALASVSSNGQNVAVIGCTSTSITNLCPGLYVLKFVEKTGKTYEGYVEVRGLSVVALAVESTLCCNGEIHLQLAALCPVYKDIQAELYPVCKSLCKKSCCSSNTQLVGGADAGLLSKKPVNPTADFLGLCPGCYKIKVYGVDATIPCCDEKCCEKYHCEPCLEEAVPPVSQCAACCKHDPRVKQACCTRLICERFIEVPRNEHLTLNWTVQNAKCGQANGKVILIAGGGTGSYEFADITKVFHVSEDNEYTFDNLTVGAHTFFVKSGTKSREVEIVVGEASSGKDVEIVSIVFGDCCESCSKRATIKAAKGYGNYYYKVDTGSYTKDNVFKDLAEGTHTARVISLENATDDPNNPTGKYYVDQKQFEVRHRKEHSNKKSKKRYDYSSRYWRLWNIIGIWLIFLGLGFIGFGLMTYYDINPSELVDNIMVSI